MKSETTPLNERLLNVSCDVLMYVVVFSWAAVALVLIATAGGKHGC